MSWSGSGFAIRDSHTHMSTVHHCCRCAPARVVALVFAWLFITASPLLATTVTAEWEPNPEPDIAGYVLSYGTQSGTYTTTIDVGEVTSFSFSLAAGQTYFVVLQAYDTDGEISDYSNEVICGVSSEPVTPGGSLTPYSGTPIALPGTIAAERFDNGGEGIAFHDTTPENTGGQFRTTGVDIETASEGGYNIGWIGAGEWVNYTVTVPSAGTYSVQLRVASSGGASFHLGFNTASNVWQTIAVPATGGWQNWTTVTVPVTLGAGTQQMTLLFDTGGMNFRQAVVTAAAMPAVPTLSPYSGTPVSVPGTIAAEKFDNGGEGIAFHDTTSGNTGGQFRTTSVDVETASEGGYDVGWIAAGEWLNYTVSVPAAGTYTVQLRVASPGGASFHLGFNTASNVWKTVAVPATGGWQNWTTVTVPVTLGAGTQQMTLLFDTGGMNFRLATVGH
jgi:hypothetical protein